VLNSRGFGESFELELQRARRSAQPLSLVLCDLDRFKRVNDRYGHQHGDRALARLAEVLRQVKRRIDTVARVGGEEFALLLPGTDSHGAYVLAERLRKEVREAFDADGLGLTLSLGVATYPRHGNTEEEMLRAADQGLYGAKELGRDRTVIYSPEIDGLLAHAAERRTAEAEIQLATVVTLAEALDIRDNGTPRHSREVSRYAELMARRLGLPPERCERLRLAGLVHDIGKVGVHESVVRKAGPLDEGEWKEMRRHPELGARILGGAGLGDIGGWLLAHHERPDGRGYPQRLSGEEIPLEAAILAVADAYEGMIADRGYRPGMPEREARAELRRCAGTQFHPPVVEALIDALTELESAETAGGEIPGGLA
jgi:diguanylate cyclase (GGDEF)-like protein/putative nucleotidyltransferase with HDIG domain